MASPLTQQSRPDSFEPKVVQLYLRLFSTLSDSNLDEEFPSEGFWRELFLLKPDRQKLYEILEPMTAEEMLHLQLQTRAFFVRAIAELRTGNVPQDENAFENLAGFLSAVFTKKWPSPNTDVIEVLSGLDTIDVLMSEFVDKVEATIRQSDRVDLRKKAVDTCLAMVSGSFQTSITTYFMHKDLFPALVKFIDEVPQQDARAVALIGFLANYNKFESQNIYQTRLEDFVNESRIKLLVTNFATSIHQLRQGYVAIQNDEPVPWTFNSTLAMVGLRGLTSDNGRSTPPPNEEEARALFNALPGPEASCLLSLYTFAQANKLFASSLVSQPAVINQESPFSLFLSATSYLAHHAYRSPRSSHYTLFCFLTIRVMLEDSILVKKLCSSDGKTTVRLCRQRPPHTPLVTSPRIPATVLLDICTDTMSHNLRKRLDVRLYSLVLGIILRLVTHLERNKIRLQHHWAYLWGSLLSMIRFLTQYAAEVIHLRGIREDLCTTLANLAAFCLSKGDGFLPDPASYDDLFYKLIESSDLLPRFKKAYTVGTSSTDSFSRAVDALISVSTHYHELLKAQPGKKSHQSPAVIQKVIKEGYETLNIEVDAEFGRWEVPGSDLFTSWLVKHLQSLQLIGTSTFVLLTGLRKIPAEEEVALRSLYSSLAALLQPPSSAASYKRRNLPMKSEVLPPPGVSKGLSASHSRTLQTNLIHLATGKESKDIQRRATASEFSSHSTQETMNPNDESKQIVHASRACSDVRQISLPPRRLTIFDLPAEIRMQIYRPVLHCPVVIHVMDKNCKDKRQVFFLACRNFDPYSKQPCSICLDFELSSRKIFASDIHRVDTALLAVNTKVRVEASWALGLWNTFRFAGLNVLDLFLCSLPEILPHLKRLIISEVYLINYQLTDAEVRMLRWVAREVRQLKLLAISLLLLNRSDLRPLHELDWTYLNPSLNFFRPLSKLSCDEVRVEIYGEPREAGTLALLTKKARAILCRDCSEAEEPQVPCARDRDQVEAGQHTPLARYLWEEGSIMRPE